MTTTNKISAADLRVRDPFIVCHGGRYYLYAAGDAGARSVTCRVSDDLVWFSDPTDVFSAPEGFWATKDFWAPEVHRYGDKWYLLHSLKSDSARRGTQIFCADEPFPQSGAMFRPISDGPVTPREWECLDGTLFVEDGQPYLVFCHEWLQIGDGEICAMPLQEDLRAPAGEPVTLFSAGQSGLARPFPDSHLPGVPCYVTDGPFLYRMKSGALAMLWSSFAGDYFLAAAISKSGRLAGPWTHENPLLCSGDGGHGMIFTDAAGRACVAMHAPNCTPNERMRVYLLEETDGVLRLGRPAV